MAVTVADVMREVRNCFPADTVSGEWTIAGGVLSPDDLLLLEGDWILIRGTGRAGGIRRVGEHGVIEGVRDGHFRGEITLLRPPEEFLALCSEIDEWARRNGMDPVTAERFGDFSQVRAKDRAGAPVDWPQAFRARLMPYRRLIGMETY